MGNRPGLGLKESYSAAAEGATPFSDTNDWQPESAMGGQRDACQ